MAQQAVAQPKSVLRGHRTQVHVTTFIRQNQRLASGDADGFVVLWDLTIMRPRAVWHAHNNAILGISGWGDDKLITEGRDNRLIVWKLAAADEATLSTALPLEESAPERPQPWILHIIEINTMNFCSFASCASRQDMDRNISNELLVAVPNTLVTEDVDIYHLPSQGRQSTVPLGSKTEKKGMVMSLSLFWLHESLFLLAGYENGLAVVARQKHGGSWHVLYKCQAHSQPILSLDLAPTKDYFLTSGADAIIAKHPIPDVNPAETAETVTEVAASPMKTIKTKHSGQQGLRIRSDGRIFATAGWDSKVRVYSAKTMAELAVLKWHDVGCYATAFSVLAHDQKDTSGSSQNVTQKDPNTAKGRETAMVTTTTRAGELSVKDRRIRMAKEAHWLAVGSKDGKISLWDIY